MSDTIDNALTTMRRTERRKLAERLRAVTRWELTNYGQSLKKCKDGEFASGDELDDIIAELEGETGGTDDGR